MRELDHKESWVSKNWCFWTVVLEKTLESPLDYKEIQPVLPKGNQLEYPLEGLMLKLKLQYFGRLMRRTDSLEKIPMLAKTEDRRIKGRQRMRWLDSITNSVDMSLNSQGVGDGQGGLVCCSPWGRKELDTTEWLIWSKLEKGESFCLNQLNSRENGICFLSAFISHPNSWYWSASSEAMITMVSLTSSRAPLPSPAHSALECRPPHCSLNHSDTLWPGAFVLALSQAWNVLFLLIHLAHSLTTSSPCCSFSSRRPLLNALFNIKNHTFDFAPQLSQSFSPAQRLSIFTQ